MNPGRETGTLETQAVLIISEDAEFSRAIVGRWRWLPLATGLMGFCGFVLFSGPNINATFLAFRTLFALGLIGLGVMLWLEQREAAQ